MFKVFIYQTKSWNFTQTFFCIDNLNSNRMLLLESLTHSMIFFFGSLIKKKKKSILLEKEANVNKLG